MTVSSHPKPAVLAPPPVYATPEDLERLRELARRGAGETWGAALLLREVDRLNPDVSAAATRFVQLNSVVTYKDLSSKRIQRVRITASYATSSHGDAVSVLSPVGAALIGLEEGSIFRWMVPSGRFRAVKVLAVDG